MEVHVELQEAGLGDRVKVVIHAARGICDDTVDHRVQLGPAQELDEVVRSEKKHDCFASRHCQR
eukprot:2755442-Heterocapsa_arctica.AAC.1